MRAGWRAGVTSGRPGTRTSWLAERNGRLARPHRAKVPLLCRRRFCPALSLLHPVSRFLQCSPPRSGCPIHRLNPVLCGLLLPIRGDALLSAVVPLRREVRSLQKSHAHPIHSIVSLAKGFDPKINMECLSGFPPRLIRPLGMEPLDLEIDGYLSPLTTPKGHGPGIGPIFWARDRAWCIKLAAVS
jgi:hypothetical protein